MAIQVRGTHERPRLDRDQGCLIGSRCLRCQAASWPGRAVCHRCGSRDLEEAALSASGRLITFTRVYVPRPGLAVPYALGQVELPEGVRIFAHVRGLPPDAKVPSPVRLVLSSDIGTVPPFWFEPEPK